MTTGRGALVALILTATAAFVVGVVLERHETHNEAAETPARRAAESPAQRAAESTSSRTTAEHPRSSESAGSESAQHSDSGESGASATPKKTTESNPTSSTARAPTAEPTTHSKESERLLGIDPESTGLLVVAVAASLFLAAGVWWLGASASVLGAVALAMAAFAALDVREIVHQADESRTGLMLLAALVAALHTAAALLAARAAAAARDPGPPATSRATG